MVRLIKDNNKINGLEWEHKRIEFDPADIAEITTILSLLDGHSTTAEIIYKSDLPAMIVELILQTLLCGSSSISQLTSDTVE